MSDSEADEATQEPEYNRKRLTIAYYFRFFIGLVLLILALVSLGYYDEMKANGLPYYIGAFSTGLAMIIALGLNLRFFQAVLYKRPSVKQKTLYLRIEVVIFAITLIFGIVGMVVAGKNGIQAPPCKSYGSCETIKYESTTNFKLALAILCTLLISLIVNTVYIVEYWGVIKTKGVHFFGSGNASSLPQNQHRETQILTDFSRGFGVVPSPHRGVVLHGPGEQSNVDSLPMSFDGRNIHTGPQMVRYQHDPIVLNTRHGQPEPFQGVVLSHPYNRNNNMTRSDQNRTVPYNGDPIVLNMRHGQPEPFPGAILSTNTQSSGSSGSNANSRLVSDLELQNQRLLEEVARQQRLLEIDRHHNAQPTASDTDAPPPSYDACVRDHSQNTYVEEKKRLADQYQQEGKVLSEDMSAYREDDHNSITPSAPPL
ncbi:hypothetical protein ACF0H5_005970 [Mactra antiquata]